MKFGVREICDVVLRAKAAQKIGKKVFYKNEPVIYFDSLKTSTLEGQSTTVYAQGGRGNARLIGWDGERTVTFTMEDALISPMGIAILTGAGLIEAESNNSIKMHTTEIVEASSIDYSEEAGEVKIKLSQLPYIPGFEQKVDAQTSAVSYESDGNSYSIDKRKHEDFIYVMTLENDEPSSEPFIPSEIKISEVKDNPNFADSDVRYEIVIKSVDDSSVVQKKGNEEIEITRTNDLSAFDTALHPDLRVLVDYYVEHKSGAFEVDITPDAFGCNFYLEAATLFRDTNGVDMPAEFIIPNCKIQSNFTFSMASSGDPSTFTFTMDAFPDYTRWNSKKKVLAAIQVLDTSSTTHDFVRPGTGHNQSKVKTGTGSGAYSAHDVYTGTQERFIEI